MKLKIRKASVKDAVFFYELRNEIIKIETIENNYKNFFKIQR